MIDVMFEAPSRTDLKKCVVTRDLVEKRSSSALLIVGDKKTDKVIGYSWGFGPCSEGFRTILSGYKWALPDYAYVQLKTLGDLLLYTVTSQHGSTHSIAPRVGRILDNGKGIIDVELILQKTASRILRVRVQANDKFGRISFFEPDSKQEY